MHFGPAPAPPICQRRELRGIRSPMGTLFVVGTPIGNLEDITRRAARVLGEVSLIAAEDTRVSRRLLTHLGLRAPLVSYNRHNWRSRIPRVLRALEMGNVALVCDAGMPGISDPGSQLVSAAAAQGFPVEVAPGPSALTAALSVSGLDADAFAFLGFLPRNSRDRRRRLRELASQPMTLVLFEAPHRLRATLDDALDELGDRAVALCRELTKLHEEVFRGSLSQAIHLAQEPRGEYVVVIEGATKTAEPLDPGLLAEEAATRLSRLRQEGAKAQEAVAEVAGSLGLPKNLVYRLWVETGPRRHG